MGCVCHSCSHFCISVFVEVSVKTPRYCFRPLERQLLLSSRSLNGTVLRRHRIKDSSNYKCGSKQRALGWKVPASRIIKQNSQINRYFSAEEKMNSVLERDGKFISAPRGEGSQGGRVSERRPVGLLKSPAASYCLP